MALITIANGGTLSGSAGGVTAQGSPSGLILRSRTRPRNSTTGLQRASQTALIQANNLWANQLAPSERDSWNQYAIVNPTISLSLRTRTMTGQGWFVLYQVYNGYGAVNGQPPLAMPAAVLKPPPPCHVVGSLAYVPGPANQFVWNSIQAYELIGNEYYWLYVSLPTKVGILPKASDMRFFHMYGLGRVAPPFQVENFGESDPFWNLRAPGSLVCMTFAITGENSYSSDDVMLYQVP